VSFEAYFSCISFVTDFTPPTVLATLTTSLISSRELTKPLTRAIARIVQSVKCGEQRGGPSERGNERGGSIESRSARCCYVIEKRTDEDSASDA
jgi:hypothetical protein